MLFADRVKDVSTTAGTGNFTLSGSPPVGFIAFGTAFATGSTNKFNYQIDGGAEWEVGIGYLSAATTLVRETVLESSNAGAAVDFSAGTTKVVFHGPSADWFNQQLSIQSGIALLVGGVEVAVDISTKQNLYTVPTGKKCIVTHVIGRHPTGSNYSAPTSATLGFNAGANDWGTMGNWGELTGAGGFGRFIGAYQFADIVGNGSSVIGAAGDVFGIKFAGDGGQDNTVFIDVFGYLYDA